MASSCSVSIMKEVKKLMRKPLDDIEIKIKNDNISILSAIISGPESTPFENGKFEIALHFTNNYPQQPPKGYFVTKIFHPNVAPSNGEICVNTLKKDWKPDYGIKHILIAVRSLLIVPNYDSALNAEAGKLLLTSYQSYVERAKLFTKIHAIPLNNNRRNKMKEEERNTNDRNTNKRNTNGGDKENVNDTKKDSDEESEQSDKCLKDKAKNRNKENDGNTKCDENNPNNKMSKKHKSKGKKGKSKKSKVSKSMRRL